MKVVVELIILYPSICFCQQPAGGKGSAPRKSVPDVEKEEIKKVRNLFYSYVQFPRSNKMQKLLNRRIVAPVFFPIFNLQNHVITTGVWFE